MNIFVTSPCPRLSAEYLDDKRAIKMILESAQILSTVMRKEGYTHPLLYKSTHVHHPCVRWVMEDLSHFSWLLEHLRHLGSRYHTTHGRTHKSMQLEPVFTEYLEHQTNGMSLPAPKYFVNCAANKSLGLDYRYIEYVPLAYQYYLTERNRRDHYAKLGY